jgi:hypothetical protein
VLNNTIPPEVSMLNNTTPPEVSMRNITPSHLR